MTHLQKLILEAANTNAADINEILLIYYLSDEWKKAEDKNLLIKQLEIKKNKISDKDYDLQDSRAKSMADEIHKFIRSGYFNIKKVFWTARPGVLQSAVGKKKKVDSGNPTDVLIQFSDNTFLGISAKSTKKNSDIGFKNLGLGTLEKVLNLKLTDIKNQYEKNFYEKHELSSIAKKRKIEIRANKKLIELANQQRTLLLNDLREELLIKLQSMKEDAVREHITSLWLDATDEVYPFYIKVTGKKSGATIENPLENDKISNLNKGNIQFVPVGNDSVGVMANGKRIMKMRFKYESQAMAGSIKLSGDPWK
jgi:hypothetical protein